MPEAAHNAVVCLKRKYEAVVGGLGASVGRRGEVHAPAQMHEPEVNEVRGICDHAGLGVRHSLNALFLYLLVCALSQECQRAERKSAAGLVDL